MKQNIDDLGIVGIIVDDWDIAKSFKPKTITTDYSTWTTYISRRAVPANTPITDLYYWKPISRLDEQLAFDYNEFKDTMVRNFYNLRQLVYSFLNSTEHGTALASELGDGDFIAVSQHYLTDVINGLYKKFEDITGESITGFDVVVTPSYFIGSNGANVHITASTINLSGVFERIDIYINDEWITGGDNINTLEYNTEISDTSYIRVDAKILGIPYSETRIIKHLDAFFLGAGNSYSDVMDASHVIPVENNMRGAYDVNIHNNEHIILVVESIFRDAFIRADINGVEIQFTEDAVTIDDVDYNVLTSVETYNSGTCNIDING